MTCACLRLLPRAAAAEERRRSRSVQGGPNSSGQACRAQPAAHAGLRTCEPGCPAWDADLLACVGYTLQRVAGCAVHTRLRTLPVAGGRTKGRAHHAALQRNRAAGEDVQGAQWAQRARLELVQCDDRCGVNRSCTNNTSSRHACKLQVIFGETVSHALCMGPTACWRIAWHAAPRSSSSSRTQLAQDALAFIDDDHAQDCR